MRHSFPPTRLVTLMLETLYSTNTVYANWKQSPEYLAPYIILIRVMVMAFAHHVVSQHVVVCAVNKTMYASK